MGLFSKAIGLEGGEKPVEANHPGLFSRAQSAQHEDIEPSEVKKKARRVKKHSVRRSRLSR